jgi:hypothetical protein
MPLNGDDIAAVAVAVADAIKPLRERIEALESRESTSYRGVWSPIEAYKGGALITDHGSLWHARRDSENERPGQSDAWQLAVKRGRNGKDAR